LANPQYKIGSRDAVTVFDQDDFKRWLCHFTIYDGRL
jgi:hypothetical protein